MGQSERERSAATCAIAAVTRTVLSLLAKEGFRREAFELTAEAQGAATTGTELHGLIWDSVERIIAKKLPASRELAAALDDLDRAYRALFKGLAAP